MSTKIKACPFCDHAGTVVRSFDTDANDHHREYVVMCANCGAEGPSDLGKSGAIEMWNLRRAADDLLTACKTIVRRWDSPGDFITSDEINSIRAAIARAEPEAMR